MVVRNNTQSTFFISGVYVTIVRVCCREISAIELILELLEDSTIVCTMQHHPGFQTVSVLLPPYNQKPGC